MTIDVNVVGGGAIGLTTAAALAARKVRVRVIRTTRAGEASKASAGMLAPSVERASTREADGSGESAANRFAFAARDRYVTYVDWLYEQTGITVPLNRLGVLQVALSEAGVKGLRKSAPSTAQWLDKQELTEAEPALAHAFGALLNPNDGAVDVPMLLTALEQLVADSPAVQVVDGVVEAVDGSDVLMQGGARYSGAHTVLAAGAWSGQIAGAPLAEVEPVRGQIVAYPVTPMRRVAYGPTGYVVPRITGQTLAGSTMERAGFEAVTTEEGIAKVRLAGEDICPALAQAGVSATWAGLRPVTPDLLPIIGRDPENPALIYACGHSRNGVLLAPLTADVVADLLDDTPVLHDLSQFRPGRFAD